MDELFCKKSQYNCFGFLKVILSKIPDQLMHPRQFCVPFLYLFRHVAEEKRKESVTLNIYTIRKQNLPWIFLCWEAVMFHLKNLNHLLPAGHGDSGTNVQKSNITYGASFWLRFEMLSGSRPPELLWGNRLHRGFCITDNLEKTFAKKTHLPWLHRTSFSFRLLFSHFTH